MLDKQQADKRGKALLDKMRGDGWKLDVWENLGWHYSVCNGAMSVHASSLGAPEDGSEDTFFCLMGTDRDQSHDSGHPAWGSDFKSNDPNEVVLAQIRKAREVLNVYIKAVKHIEGIYGLEP